MCLCVKNIFVLAHNAAGTKGNSLSSNELRLLTIVSAINGRKSRYNYHLGEGREQQLIENIRMLLISTACGDKQVIPATDRFIAVLKNAQLLSWK